MLSVAVAIVRTARISSFRRLDFGALVPRNVRGARGPRCWALFGTLCWRRGWGLFAAIHAPNTATVVPGRSTRLARALAREWYRLGSMFEQPPPVVIFDFDGTLVSRDSFVDFSLGYCLARPWRLLLVGLLAPIAGLMWWRSMRKAASILLWGMTVGASTRSFVLALRRYGERRLPRFTHEAVCAELVSRLHRQLRRPRARERGTRGSLGGPGSTHPGPPSPADPLGR